MVTRTHAVHVLRDGQVLKEMAGVSAAEVGRLVLELRAHYGEGARVLVDGAEFDPQAIAKIAAEVTPPPLTDRSTAAHGQPGQPPRAPPRIVGEVNPLAVAEVSFTMLWDTYDRAATVQAWLLNQASTFTAELLDNHRKLAEQASELQKRYQASIAEIDVLAREKMMMDAEASASRYGRFLLDRAREEAASARPARAPREWLDEMIDGIAFAVGMMGGARPPREPWDPN
ncbi:MAG: hypothetical protein JNL82_29600 [Myxococcales bacterium]|nr:hypothetical protein [Myxococcales bacterium]